MKIPNIDWAQMIEAIGILNFVVSIIILSCHFFILMLYNARLKDRQNEINRLAKENHEYRERFLKLLDNKFGDQK